MFTEKQTEELLELLASLETTTKVYFGCDSIRCYRNNRPMGKYATVVVVHKNGNNGCRIFRHISYEPDYDREPGRPKLRILTEAQKVCELYNELIPLIKGYDVEIHLDISTDPKMGSNIVIAEATGYVLGLTGIAPEQIKVKPHGHASTVGADAIVNGKLQTSTKRH